MTTIPPELRALIDGQQAEIGAEIAKIKLKTQVTLRLIDIYSNLMGGTAGARDQVEAGLTYLEDAILRGEPEHLALLRLADVDKPVPDMPLKKIERLLEQILSKIDDLSGRVGRVEIHLTGTGFKAEERTGSEPGGSTGSQGKDRPASDEPTQAELDFLASQDYVQAQPVEVRHGGGRGGNHVVNESVIGTPLAERAHILGLRESMAFLAKELGRPVNIKELSSEMDRRKVDWRHMSPGWLGVYLSQNYIAWGNVRKGGGGWWPVTMPLKPAGSVFFQQARLPSNIAASAEGRKVTAAYSALRIGHGEAALIVTEYRGPAHRRADDKPGEAETA